jgi:hypothetical protein
MQSWAPWPLDHRPAGAVPRWFVGHHRAWSAADEPTEAVESDGRARHDPCRWGLSAAATAPVGARLEEVWLRLRDCCRPRTRDTSATASTALRGPLTMANARNCAKMARHMTGDDGQALQHLMANAPWSGPAVCGQRQAESKATPAVAQGRTRMREERAEEQAGTHKAGASRQDKGRMGTGAVCRGDTCLAYATGGRWAMVEGARCVPEAWCGAACAATRPALGLPQERTCETHIALGLQRVQRVKAHGVPCALLACDARSGRERQCRAEVDAAGGRYAAQVPADTTVEVSAPQGGVPAQRSTRGRPRTRLQGLGRQRPCAVRVLARHPQTVWQHVMVRDTARGRLAADCAVRRVWTVAAGTRPRGAWWVRRREAEGACS